MAATAAAAEALRQADGAPNCSSCSTCDAQTCSCQASIRRAIMIRYAMPKPADVGQIGERWRPWACMYLWRSLRVTPVYPRADCKTRQSPPVRRGKAT